MGFKFRKIIKIAPGLKINLSKTGVSASVGKQGATVNFSSKGVKTTGGVPGTGFGYQKYFSYRKMNREHVYMAAKVIICALAFIGLLALFWVFGQGT